MLLIAVLAGCATEEPVELTQPDEPIGTWPPPAPEVGKQLHIVGEPLQPGEEIEMCQYIKLGNDEAGAYSSISLHAAPGLHHSIVSRISSKHKNESMPCFGFPSDIGFELPLPLFATSTQVDTEAIELPEGVAIQIDAHQQLIVNYHYLNTTREPITPEIFLNFEEMDPADVVANAGFYSFTNFSDIRIPPHGSQKLTMSCDFPDPALVITTTPHMHQLGSRFEVRRFDGEAPAEVLAEYEGYFDPETTRFEPGVTIGKGEGLTITCEWESDVDHTTYFGETSEDEMCFVFGYFYPAAYDVIGVDGYGCTVDENVITEQGAG